MTTPDSFRTLLTTGVPRVAVPFTDGTSDEELLEAIGAGLDVAEIRIDLFATTEPAVVLEQVQRFGAAPTLATIRSAAEGGGWTGTDADRLRLFEVVLPTVDAIDIELSSRAILAEVIAAARTAGKPVIVSSHDFARTPPLEDLEGFVADARAAGADFAKVATLAQEPADLATLAALTIGHAGDGLIAVGMGELGPASRIFLPILGSALTYAAGRQHLVSGQLSLADTVAALADLSPAYAAAGDERHTPEP